MGSLIGLAAEMACHNSIMLVLASASPRRSELLTQAGYRFRVHPAHIPEDPLPGEDPIVYVTRLAREKAEAVYRELTAGGDSKEERADGQSLAVLGADTTVTLDNTILGVALVTAAGVEVAAEATAVRFLTLSDAEIAEYVAGGEPMDKAGAYAIQGRAARWIPRIEGCYFNVMGLPLALVSSLLESCNCLE